MNGFRFGNERAAQSCVPFLPRQPGITCRNTLDDREAWRCLSQAQWR